MTLALLLSLAQTVVAGQGEVQLTLERDSVRLGEPLALSVTLSGVPAAARVIFPEFPDTGSLAALGPPTVAERGDALSRTARYEIVAWRLGRVELPRLRVRLLSGSVELSVPLPDTSVYVVSVLPAGADPDTLARKPPADVVGDNWSLAERLAASLLALAALVAAVLYVRRRGRAAPVPIPGPAPAKERALAAITALERSGRAEAGELKGFYSALSQIVREFLAEVDRRWGLDLTTTELMNAVAGDGLDEARILELEALLAEADGVKFTRWRPYPGQAIAALLLARDWVRGFERRFPEPDEKPAGAEAALEALFDLDRLFSESPAERAPGERGPGDGKQGWGGGPEREGSEDEADR